MPDQTGIIPEEAELKKGVMPTEQEVERLRRELAEKEAALLRLRQTKPEKIEAVLPQEKKEEVQRKIEKEKEEVLAAAEKPSKAAPPAKAQAPKITDAALATDLRYVMSMPKPRQVKVLVYFAFKKSLHHAVNIAKKMKNPYILDEFHDTLVDELYELLKKKRKI